MGETGKSSFDTGAKQLVIAIFFWGKILFSFILPIHLIPYFLKSVSNFDNFNMKNLYFVR